MCWAVGLAEEDRRPDRPPYTTLPGASVCLSMSSDGTCAFLQAWIHPGALTWHLTPKNSIGDGAAILLPAMRRGPTVGRAICFRATAAPAMAAGHGTPRGVSQHPGQE